MPKCKDKKRLPGIIVTAYSGTNGREDCEIRNKSHLCHVVKIRNLHLFSVNVTLGGRIQSTDMKVKFVPANGNFYVRDHDWFKTDDLLQYEEDVYEEAHIVGVTPMKAGEETIYTYVDAKWYQDEETVSVRLEFDVKTY